VRHKREAAGEWGKGPCSPSTTSRIPQ
jgi:hypothetical protein